MRARPLLTVPGAVLGALGMVLLVLASALVLAPAALAHDNLRSADPAPGGRTVGVPRVVHLEFLTPPRPDPRTFVSVVGPGGRDLATGEAAVSGLGLDQPVERAEVSGTYVVTYAVAAADGHLAQGRYTFELRVPSHAADSGGGALGTLLLLGAVAFVTTALVVVARAKARASAPPAA